MLFQRACQRCLFLGKQEEEEEVLFSSFLKASPSRSSPAPSWRAGQLESPSGQWWCLSVLSAMVSSLADPPGLQLRATGAALPWDKRQQAQAREDSPVSLAGGGV